MKEKEIIEIQRKSHEQLIEAEMEVMMQCGGMTRMKDWVEADPMHRAVVLVAIDTNIHEAWMERTGDGRGLAKDCTSLTRAAVYGNDYPLNLAVADLLEDERFELVDRLRENH